MTDFSVKGRKALVTGGARGIGAAVSEILLRYGASVIVCDQNEAAWGSEDAVSRGLTKHPECLYFPCDISDAGAVGKLGQWCESELGGVDILVNCAGVDDEVDFHAMGVDRFDKIINVNLRGTFLVTQAVYQGMMRNGSGRIINIASQLAYKGSEKKVHYCASKAGVIGFTRALALEAAPHGINVNAVAPGPVETRMLSGLSDEWRAKKLHSLPIGHFGRVEDICATILLLASDQGAFYVGQTLSPNGGDVFL
ncbi:SDR family oxidoreductase [Allopusillimonas ginsengisoli]|nr:SDR family oxidoreductase [Allopusillimonas ginsengisoli]